VPATVAVIIVVPFPTGRTVPVVELARVTVATAGFDELHDTPLLR
jgi:hypothetical protein